MPEIRAGSLRAVRDAVLTGRIRRGASEAISIATVGKWTYIVRLRTGPAVERAGVPGSHSPTDR